MALYTDHSTATNYNIKHTRQCCVFVGNISYESTEEALFQIFGRCGAVQQFRILKERDAKTHKGYGFCEFKDPESAELCVRTMNGVDCYGRPLRIDTADVDVKTLEMLGATRQRDFLELQAQMLGMHEVNYHAEVSGLVGAMKTSDLFLALAHVQLLAKNNPTEARAFLTKNLGVCHAMMHAQFLATMHQKPMECMNRKEIDHANWSNNVVTGSSSAAQGSSVSGGQAHGGAAMSVAGMASASNAMKDTWRYEDTYGQNKSFKGGAATAKGGAATAVSYDDYYEMKGGDGGKGSGNKGYYEKGSWYPTRMGSSMYEKGGFGSSYASASGAYARAAPYDINRVRRVG